MSVTTEPTDWGQWLEEYDLYPSLQARLQLVQAQIASALDECPPGPVQIVSLCAGDGRDLRLALQNHPRRSDVSAWLIDREAGSVDRGRIAAEQCGLQRQMNFICADAAFAKNYLPAVPANLVLLSGLLGHLRPECLPGLFKNLAMFCQPGGFVIWNRHLVLHDGRARVREIRELLQTAAFEEKQFAVTAPDGFAVGRAQFKGRTEPLDSSRRLFEFVGIGRLMAEASGPARRNGDYSLAIEIETDEIEPSIPERFAQIVSQHSQRRAIGTGSWQPTYAELNASANRWAHALVSTGGEVGDRVALLMQQDGPLVAAMLAVLKAGRVMVVLSPSDPPARLLQIVEDAGPTVIFTDLENRELTAQIAGTLRSILCFQETLDKPDTEPEKPLQSNTLAALIYTSGSTGRPKGVMLTHGNILSNVLRHSRGLELRPEDRVLLAGSPGGGQGLAIVWVALLNGVALCPFPAAERGVTGLARWLRDHEISVYISSVSVFRHLVRTLGENDRFPRVRLVRFASEAASMEDFASYRKFFRDDCILLNTLSSSETGNILRQRYTQSDPVAVGRLSVGREVAGVKILLVDEQGREVAAGETGEMIVGGRQLSPGYWRNDTMTAEKFFTDDKTGVRFYRSGDLARRLPDGTFMFMDRRDARVKVNGYRVELSEVADALLQLPPIQDAVVQPLTQPDGNVQLIGYVVLRPGKAYKAEQLRHDLRNNLPGYMIPAHVVFLDRLPLTANGKVDRQALPKPSHAKVLSRAERPRDIVETSLARIWESVLGLAPIGRAEDFFDLGGNSLQSSQVLARIEESWGASLPPSTLIEYGTIARLATLISGRVVVASPTPLVPLRSAPAGRPLFLIHSGQGDVATYGLLARRLGGRPVFGLQAVGLQGESWPLTSVPAMAERYLQEILNQDGHGPYFLGATCMGGLVALELARRLHEAGKKVALLALFDVPYPRKTWQHPRFKERFYGILRDPVRDLFRMLRWRAIRGMGWGRTDRWQTAYRRFVAHMCSHANRNCTPKFYPGKATMFLTTETRYEGEDLRLKLRSFVPELVVEYLPGRRAGLFMPPVVDLLAEKLRAAMDAAEKESLR